MITDTERLDFLLNNPFLRPTGSEKEGWSMVDTRHDITLPIPLSRSPREAVDRAIRTEQSVKADPPADFDVSTSLSRLTRRLGRRAANTQTSGKPHSAR